MERWSITKTGGFKQRHLMSVLMALQDQVSPLRFAFLGFLIAVVVGVVIEILVFEGDLVRAAITAGGIGLGVGIGFYAVLSTRTEKGR